MTVFTPEAGEWADPILIALVLCVMIAFLRDRRAKRRVSSGQDHVSQVPPAPDRRDDDAEPR